MIYQCYVIYDKVEKRHTSPFCSPSQEVTLRMVREQISQVPHVKDKQVRHVGWFDDEAGKMYGKDGFTQVIEPVELSTLTDITRGGEDEIQ